MNVDSASAASSNTAAFKRQLGERRACQQCSNAKAKCTYKDITTICERCDRLRKPCSQQPVNLVKRHRVAKKQASRNAQLEQKLDHLTSMIARQAPPAEGYQRPQDDRPGSADSWGRTVAQSPPMQFPIHSLPSPSSEQSAHRIGQTDTLGSHGRQSSTEPVSPVLSLDTAEAQKLFESWRPAMHQSYPFVPMPACADFDTWSVERPFLTAAIITAALWGNMARQLDFAQRTMEYIVVHLLLKGHKNLDVLQALLVTFCWYFFHIVKNPQATNILHLATGLVLDLGLNRVPDRNQAVRMKLFAMRKPIHGRTVQGEPLNLEQRRALLGCYYVTSGVSVAFAKSQPLKWTRIMDESCAILENEKKLETDATLVALARGQRLLERIDEGFANPEHMILQSCGSPVLVMVRSWQTDLKKFWDTVPPSIRGTRSLQILYHFSHIQLYDSGLDALPVTTGEGSTQDSARLQRRVELYQALQDSFRSFFDTFFAISPTEVHYTAFDVLSKTANAIVMLARNGEATDHEQMLQSVEHPMSISETIERSSAFFNDADRAAKQAGHSPGENHLFARWSWRLNRFKKIMQSELVEEPQSMVLNIDRGDRGGFAASETPEHFPATSTELGLVTSTNSLDSSLMNFDFQDLSRTNDHWNGNPGMSQCPMS